MAKLFAWGGCVCVCVCAWTLSADGFVLRNSVPRSTVLLASKPAELTRRDLLDKVAGVIAVSALVPTLANADGAVSIATKQRARGLYGDRILSLEQAVNKGDFAALEGEETAFDLFVNGAFPPGSGIDKKRREEVLKLKGEVLAAAKDGDKAALQAAFTNFKAAADLKARKIDETRGLTYMSDYHYNVGRVQPRVGP